MRETKIIDKIREKIMTFQTIDFLRGNEKIKDELLDNTLVKINIKYELDYFNSKDR